VAEEVAMSAEPGPVGGRDGLDPIAVEDVPRGPGAPVEVVAVIPAKDEETRIGATIAALEQVGSIGWVVVVDDGSTDQTAAVAEWTGGVEVVRHGRNRGKAAAMTSGARRAAELAPGAPVLFVDADLEGSAANLGPLVGPVLTGVADMTIAVLPAQLRRGGGLGLVVRTARAGIRRLTGWTPTQPLSGQRCLSRAVLDAAMPLAPGWGVEVGLTVDVLRAGGRVLEVPCELHHRVTGRDLASQVHRARQLADVTRALAERSPTAERARERASGYADQLRVRSRDYAGRAREGASGSVVRARQAWTDRATGRAAVPRGRRAAARGPDDPAGLGPGAAEDAHGGRDEHRQGERDRGDAGVVERPGEGHADQGGQGHGRHTGQAPEGR
jgi:hypothetical protein